MIWDDALPIFDNYDYSYKIYHGHLAVKTKLIANRYSLMPYVSASLGVAWNNAHGFNSTPRIVEAVPTPNFAPRTTTSFTYTLGVGVQGAVSENLQVGIGYEFADWGQSRLGPVIRQTSRNGLTHNHVYTNGLMFTISYLAKGSSYETK